MLEFKSCWTKSRGVGDLRRHDARFVKFLQVCLSQLIEAEWRIYASIHEVVIGSYNGLVPVRRQAIIWTDSVILLSGLL